MGVGGSLDLILAITENTSIARVVVLDLSRNVLLIVGVVDRPWQSLEADGLKRKRHTAIASSLSVAKILWQLFFFESESWLRTKVVIDHCALSEGCGRIWGELFSRGMERHLDTVEGWRQAISSSITKSEGIFGCMKKETIFGIEGDVSAC